jgi:hypothetical protein
MQPEHRFLAGSQVLEQAIKAQAHLRTFQFQADLVRPIRFC